MRSSSRSDRVGLEFQRFGWITGNPDITRKSMSGLPTIQELSDSRTELELETCLGLWVLKKSVLFLEFRGLNSVVELVGIAVASMKWRVSAARR